MLLLYLLIVTVSMNHLSLIHCADVCNENCAFCDDGRCRECRYGWYGHNCNNKCQNCWTSGCHKHSGKCVQCQPGRYMEDCETSCPDNCRANRRGEVYCRRADGKCLEGCKDGLWGDTCTRRCSQHCEGTCLQDTGHCFGDCSAGWWGPSCEKKCSLGCKHKRCMWESGKCVDGCNDGLHGVLCDTCSQRCEGTCQPDTGDCLGDCSAGWWSTSCVKTCPPGCRNKRCMRQSGICVYGCNAGLHGVRCDEKCSEGCTYGLCDWKRGGECKLGCKVGYTGRSCDENCNSGCVRCHRFTKECERCQSSLYGNDCSKECSTNCKDITCDMQGRCVRGCSDGFRGRICNETCPVNCLTCYQETGGCMKCKTGWTGNNCLQSKQQISMVNTGVRLGYEMALLCIALLSIVT